MNEPYETGLLVLANLAQLFIFGSGIFYFLLSLRGFFRGRRPVGDGKLHRYAVLLPAYNEEKVIRFALESLRKMDYPIELFDVFLVADHCTDRTVEIARSLGVTVFEHDGRERKPGKGRALKWAVSRILAMDKRYDAICYFDADSLAHPGFLKEMNRHFGAGEEAVQGCQLAKNTDTMVARILASGHIVSNRFFQRPKYAFGLCATLHGKGMCFSRAVSERYAWDETCLTEDIEIQMRLIRFGVPITWAESAIVYDEEPTTIPLYLKRVIRWTRGSLDVAGRHLAALFRRAFYARDYRALEGAIYCSSVYRMVIVGVTAGLIYLTRDSFNLLVWLYYALPGAAFFVKAMVLVPLVLYPAAALYLEGAGASVCFAYLLQPLLGVFRLPVFVAGVFRNTRDWGRTEHSSQVAISDLVN